ncbi:protein NRT1/ PTR FAMILY 5.6-like [Phoenix dactylifera]|uniref:Protein NRT1/ PTR FAMILY 5.6-like n=1 Tax=Phoenix dactylifera TaxID=42345 RepID=A0A8B7D2K1_PHODC|nr:protein NRT1/ PTR FAMILY 5.6-like [Phoenix dactylifera]
MGCYIKSHGAPLALSQLSAPNQSSLASSTPHLQFLFSSMRTELAATPISLMEPGMFDEKGRGEAQVEEKRVYDSSVDHKGRVPLRASTGAWKAALFIIAIEFSERLSYFGLATNLIIYLTKVLHQEVKTAAKNVNYWSGVTTVMPLIGGFIADAYLGRFSTVLCSSLIYLGGLILLTMCQLVPGLKPYHRSLRLHEIIFFVAIYLISIGTGGHKPALESFGADQFDDDHEEERKKKMSYFNWWNFGLCCGLLLGVTVIVYIEDKVSWGVADIILTSVMGISLVIFLLGRPFYRYRVPTGSPLTPMLQVLVAAMAKRHLPHPSHAGQLYEVPKSQKSDKRLLFHTNQLRFLDKAAIIEHRDDEAAFAAEKLNPWRLATVTQVEETKLILAMVPIWSASLPFGICVAQTSTFFIKQASIMDRKLAGGFDVPPASVFSLAAISMIISVSFYDKILVPFLRRATGNERGMSILRRIGIGMVFCIVAMAAAAIVERKRLRVAEAEQTSVVSMSVLWLVPQFMIMGFGDGFTIVGLQEYFYDQVPDCMRSLGLAFYLSVIGTGSFLSSLLITVADHLTGKGGRAGWFAKDLNESRLDLFYWLLAAIAAVGLCGYVYLASRYSYKNVQRKVGIANFPQQDDIESSKS